MPTYEYKCDACGHQFDEFQSMKDEALKDCPKCTQSSLRRLFGTGAAILFKGSGFYQTDYRSESYKSAAKAEQEGSSKASGGKDSSGGSGAGGSGSSPAKSDDGKTAKSSG
jgi:putative FmdB family regulatory protein